MRLKKYTLPAARRNFFPQFDGWQPKQTWVHNGLGPNLLDYAHDQLCTMYSAHYALAKTMPTINYYALAPQCTLPHYTSKLSMRHISELIQNRTTIHSYKTGSHRNINYFECPKCDKLPIIIPMTIIAIHFKCFINLHHLKWCTLSSALNIAFGY